MSYRAKVAAAAALAILVMIGAAWMYRNRPRRLVPAGPPGIELFATRRPTEKEIGALYTGAKYEPKYGAYLGAYIDLEPALQTVVRDRSNRRRRLPAEFEREVGKPHAMYFFYQLYGARTFPSKWVEKLASWGKLVQIALEPNGGLDTVRDDDYLRGLADTLRRTRAKIFLRFASEMNGPWTRYHGDPQKYIEKWRLVSRVMRERAPNVAMVWCPYATPQSLIDSYYPGDEWVDWVGVNLYSVTYYNRDGRFPGIDDNPADLLRFVYDRYAKRKPVMICEYGVANYSAFEDRDTTTFARENIKSLYWSLPRVFPRVKAVNYFSVNNMLGARKNNDYSLLSNEQVLSAYKDAIAPDYFLSASDAPVPQGPLPLDKSRLNVLPHGVTLSAWARASGRSSVVHLKSAEQDWSPMVGVSDFTYVFASDRPTVLTATAAEPGGDVVARGSWRVQTKR